MEGRGGGAAELTMSDDVSIGGGGDLSCMTILCTFLNARVERVATCVFNCADLGSGLAMIPEVSIPVSILEWISQ
jgi:hypothetical protein